MPHAPTAPITIAIGGISHESHAFAGMITALADVEERALLTGAGPIDAAITAARRIGPASVCWIAVTSAVYLHAVAYHHVRRPIVPLDSPDGVNQARARTGKVQSHV